MSDHSEATTNKPNDTTPCKMGCGFFGNAATGGCCSKCWREMQASTDANVEKSEKKQPTESESVSKEAKDQPLQQQQSQQQQQLAENVSSESQATKEPTVQMAVTVDKKLPSSSELPRKTKKKKKMSYKQMMNTMLTTAGKPKEEKEVLRESTAAFSKIDKI